MRRIRLSTGPTALLGAMIVAALLIFLPMRLALGWLGLGEAGLSAREVTGTVWSGRLVDARFGDLALGDLDAGLSPFALLVGHATVTLGRGDTLHGSIGIGRHAQDVDHLTGNLPTGRIFAPLPVTRLDLADVTIHFRDDTCDLAEGRVTALLGGDVGGIVLPASVAGNARCEGGTLLLPLASQAGTERVALRITGAGRYTATLTLVPPDPLSGQRLASAGFVTGPDGYRLSIEGSF